MSNKMATKYKRLYNGRIGTLLLDQQVITAEQLEDALTRQRTQGGRVGEILIQLTHNAAACNSTDLEEGIALAVSSQYGIPRLPLDAYKIDRAVLALVPERVAKHHCLLPVERMGSNLTVSMADPLDTKAIQGLEALTRCSIQVLIGTPSEILHAIDLHY